MGWEDGSQLPEGEQYVPKTVESLSRVSDWRKRIHVVPGCGDPFLRRLIGRLCREGVRWIHLSERSRPGLRRITGWPLKRWYGYLINQYSLGALGIGQQALDDFLRWGVRAEKLAFVPSYSPPGCDPHSSKDSAIETFCAGNHPVFVYVGSLYSGKGIDVLLKAFVGLHPTAVAEPRLVLVGDDRSGAKYHRLAVSLGISKRVLFRGPMSYKSLGGALICGDVLCFPSRADGWGVVLNEAASMSLALVSTNKAGAAMHLIEQGVNGFRTGAGDVGSLRVVMQAYVNNPELARTHGKHSRALFETFTPHRNAQRFMVAVGSLISLKGGST